VSNPPEAISSLDPEALLAWVKQRLSGEEPYESSFNWHGLAEVAAMRGAAAGASPALSEAAIRIYSWLSSRSEPNAACSFQLSEMVLRARQIAALGACEGDSVRDPNVVLGWWRSNVGLSLSEAERKTQEWRNLPVSELASLRNIKNMLGVIGRITSVFNVEERNEIERWLLLRPSLP